jgi:serine/threonine protein kinase
MSPAQTPDMAVTLSRLAEDLGDAASEEIGNLERTLDQLPVLIEQGHLEPGTDWGPTLCESLSELARWDDQRAAVSVIAAVSDQLKRSPLSITRLVPGLPEWTDAHANTPELLVDCITVAPPKYFRIRRVFSDEGNQKLVFLAEDTLGERTVILKVLRSSLESEDRRAAEPTRDERRELTPMSLRHPNIIETAFTHGPDDVLFIIEPRLSVVLRDDWPHMGVGEAVNLLIDIGRALTLLHDRDRVHADIKANNLGFSEGAYVLLDFGLCRRIAEIGESGTSPTGTLKTRAPELLAGRDLDDPRLCDVWALGATVLNALVGHYPLCSADDFPLPSVSDEDARRQKEGELLVRSQDESQWTERVELSLTRDVPNQALAELLRQMLERDPARRITASTAVSLALRRLPQFVLTPRPATARTPVAVSAHKDIACLETYLTKSDDQLKLLTWREYVALRDRLHGLDGAFDNSSDEENMRKRIVGRLDLSPHCPPSDSR